MKYKLTEETMHVGDVTLHRIECVESFSDVNVGDKGGWIENEDNLWQLGNALVCGDARVYGNAAVEATEDYIVFKNNWSSGRYFTWTRSNDMWAVGCFYGTGEALIKKAYADSKKSGKYYKAYVEFVKTLKKIDRL